MSLPIIPRAEFLIKNQLLPGGQVTLRPMTVGSETTLLQIKDSKDVDQIMTGVKQVLKDCIVDGLPPGQYPISFIEFMFMKVVSKSSGEVRDLAFICKNNVDDKECGHKNDVKLDLDQISIQPEEGFKNVFTIHGDIGIKMRMLSLDDASKLKEEATMAETIAAHVDCIFEGDKVWSRADVSDEEILGFVKSMSLEMREEIVNDFFSKMPSLKHTIKFKCPSCGHDHSVELEGLKDFFG